VCMLHGAKELMLAARSHVPPALFLGGKHVRATHLHRYVPPHLSMIELIPTCARTQAGSTEATKGTQGTAEETDAELLRELEVRRGRNPGSLLGGGVIPTAQAASTEATKGTQGKTQSVEKGAPWLPPHPCGRACVQFVRGGAPQRLM
jgi:hypothetical protein